MYENKIKSFTDLNAWKKSHELVLLVYRALEKYPSHELFCLTSQTKRSCVSVSSNIAEGFSRRSSKEKIQFYYQAQGSLTELQNQIVIGRDLKYLSGKDFKEIAQITIVVHKLINGLIKKIR